jgi:hypothetical protein
LHVRKNHRSLGVLTVGDLVIAGRIPAARREATVKAVRAFYDFWNTGDAALLKQAIADNFTVAPCRRAVH